MKLSWPKALIALLRVVSAAEMALFISSMELCTRWELATTLSCR